MPESVTGGGFESVFVRFGLKITSPGFASAVSAALSGGDRITLVGFGTFSVGSRSQHEGRNPGTGEKIQIPASKVVKFEAGKTLSEKVK